MILVKEIKNLKKYVSGSRKIGFVPTMGALHAGHISLIEQSLAENDFTVCSIFINPAQFNNPADLQKYPVTIEKDIDLLEKAGCNLLFLPSVNEMYPPGEKAVHYQLENLETILEGKYRPGHFQGVCRIVDKLLAAVAPHTLYLGKKDYQQCMVINKMIQEQKYEVDLRICDTVREINGLAMSSRNLRLSDAERQQACKIIAALQMIKSNLQPGDIRNLKSEAKLFLENNGFKVDYTEIADASTLELKETWDGNEKLVALVAAYLNDVRLIDNLICDP